MKKHFTVGTALSHRLDMKTDPIGLDMKTHPIGRIWKPTP